MQEKCLMEINPYFVVARTISAIPFVMAGLHTKHYKGNEYLSQEGTGRLLDGIDLARNTLAIELKNKPEDKEMLLSALNDIVDEGKRSDWALNDEFERYIDDAKSLAEQMLVDEAVKCECK